MDVTTVDLQAELPADSRLLALLREIAEYRGPGAVIAHLSGCDSEPAYTLQDFGMVRIALEPLGTFSEHDGSENWGQVAHLTEHGLEELVVHGRER